MVPLQGVNLLRVSLAPFHWKVLETVSNILPNGGLDGDLPWHNP